MVVPPVVANVNIVRSRILLEQVTRQNARQAYRSISIAVPLFLAHVKRLRPARVGKQILGGETEILEAADRAAETGHSLLLQLAQTGEQTPAFLEKLGGLLIEGHALYGFFGVQIEHGKARRQKTSRQSADLIRRKVERDVAGKS